MKCLIVAAGQGARLREHPELKPLVPIAGAPLIEHVIARALEAGASEFVVVNGHRGEELRAALDAVAGRTGARVTHVHNAEWRRANGVSVLAARALLGAPFLLTMCDHLVDPAILRDLMAQEAAAGTVTLAVDHDIASPNNDPEDCTRVRCEGGLIRRIGKLIADYNAYDTGAFLCTPGMFEALDASQAAGEDSISGAMTVLAGQGRARAFDVGGRVWVDVDDAPAYARAEALMAAGRL
ncbi:MAG: NTP transferase domain-containing protein [Janthinobacterium lividum]